jgi:anti-sigma-K factor RskA
MLTSSTEIHPVSSNAVTGNLLLNREQNQSYLLMWNLPPLANGLVYQVWLVGPNGERVDAGSFLPEVNSPFTSVPLNVNSRSLAEFVGIEVTIEPQGGSTMPTGEQILNTTY